MEDIFKRFILNVIYGKENRKMVDGYYLAD